MFNIFPNERGVIKMEKNLKYLLVFGTTILSFIYGLTAPTILIYFTSRVSTEVIAFSNILSLSVAAAIHNSVNIEKMLQFYRNHFVYIVIIDVIMTFTLYLFSIDFIELRYIGIGLVEAIVANLWKIIMINAINRVISADELTKFNSFSKAYELRAKVLGASLVLILDGGFDITTCIVLQGIVHILMRSIDIFVYKKLNLKYEREKAAI